MTFLYFHYCCLSFFSFRKRFLVKMSMIIITNVHLKIIHYYSLFYYYLLLKFFWNCNQFSKHLYQHHHYDIHIVRHQLHYLYCIILILVSSFYHHYFNYLHFNKFLYFRSFYFQILIVKNPNFLCHFYAIL